MIKLLTTLGAAIFLVMLIGGRESDVQRFGLAGHYTPPVTVSLADTSAPATAPGDVVLTSFPITAPLAVQPLVADLPATPLIAAAPAPADPAPPAPAALPVRYVVADAINVREGPSTSNAVIGRLTRNEAVSVVSEAESGWVRIRIEGDGLEGFVAARLLSAP